MERSFEGSLLERAPLPESGGALTALLCSARNKLQITWPNSREGSSFPGVMQRAGV